MDIPRAAGCIPGAHAVTPAGDNRYAGLVRVRVGPMQVNVAGALTVESRDDAARVAVFRLEGPDRGMAGTVRGTMTVRVAEAGTGRSSLHVDADILLAGALAGLGRHMIRRKAETLLGDFARNLGRATA